MRFISVKDKCPTKGCSFRVERIIEGTTEVRCLDCKTTIKIKKPFKRRTNGTAHR